MAKLGNTKFSDQQVRDLRARHAAAPLGIDVRATAHEYGVAPETIRRMLRGDTFSHVSGATHPQKPAGQYGPHEMIPLTAEQQEDMEGSERRLAEKYGLTAALATDKMVRELEAMPASPPLEMKPMTSEEIIWAITHPKELPGASLSPSDTKPEAVPSNPMEE